MSKYKHEYASIAELLGTPPPAKVTCGDVAKAVLFIALFVFTAFCIAVSMDPLPEEPTAPAWQAAMVPGVLNGTDQEQAGEDGTAKALLDLAYRLKGKLLLPSMDTFSSASAIWNMAAPVPLAIVEAADENDVVETMKLLERFPDLEFTIRSGGHHILGYSSVANGLVLSLSDVNSISVDDKGVFTMGPGARVQEVVHATLPQGWGTVVGICGLVAEGGHSLAGGIGYLTRKYGLAADNVVSYNVVLHNGSLVTASHHEHPELFWALRGAGSNNFGVVTQIEMQAYPTFGDIAMGEVAVPVEDAPRFFAALGTFEASIPREIFGFFTCSDLLSGAVTYVGVDEYDVIRGINYLEDEFPSLLQIDPGNMSVSRISWVEDAYAEDNMYGNLADSWTGFITKEMATEETFQTIFDELGDLLYSPYLVVEFCFIGGAINDKEPDFNAFAFRDTQYLFSLLEVVPGDLDDAQEIYEALGAKLEVVFDRLKPLLYGTLLNFPVDTSSAEEYLSAYHGEHLESLQAIKRKYDPENRFRYKQSIPI